MTNDQPKTFLLSLLFAAAGLLAACAQQGSSAAAEGDAAAPTSAGESKTVRLPPHQQLARDLLKELVEINTTHSSGDTTAASEAMAAHLRAAGFPAEDVQVLGPRPNKGNLVVRYRGRNMDRKPVLLLAHLDVVEADVADWTLDPFTFVEQEGFYYGRGTTDDKDEAAIHIANLIRLRQEEFRPDRDIIVALTADEEGGTNDGVQWQPNSSGPGFRCCRP